PGLQLQMGPARDPRSAGPRLDLRDHLRRQRVARAGRRRSPRGRGRGRAMTWPRMAQLRTTSQLRARLADLGVELPLDETLEADGPLSRPLETGGLRIGNRFAILPMEGWDGQPDGSPGPLTLRRWRRFGESGAKLVWGGEAVAVRPDGRANPNQLLIG